MNQKPVYQQLKERRVHSIICEKCGPYFSNHRSLYNHKKICPNSLKNQKRITNFKKEFQIKLIEMVIGTNMSISQVDKPYFVKLFTFLNVKESDLPSPYTLRNQIIQHSKELK